MGSCESLQQGQLGLPRQGPVRQIMITNSTWSRKYLGLFDYQSSQTETRHIKMQGNIVMTKQTSQMKAFTYKTDKASLDQLLKMQKMKQALFRLQCTDHYYHLRPIQYIEDGDLIQKPIWMVIKNLPGKSYSIQERDIIRLGKQKIKVKEVVPADQASSRIPQKNDNIRVSKHVYDDLTLKNQPEKQVQQELGKVEQSQEFKFTSKQIQQQHQDKSNTNIDKIAPQSAQTIPLQQQTQGQNICRICLQPGLVTNPLIKPCKCTGSVRYVHFLCLKTWLSKQINAQINQNSITLNWKPLICQMCKSLYKYRIFLDNKKYYTVDIPKPQKPYIVLQIMNKKSNLKTDYVKVFKFISFRNKNSINIGRKKDVDVRISEDISVSRVHATLTYQPNNCHFILQDNKSKFGTLVMAKNGLLLRPHHINMSVQIAAQVFSFQVLRAKSQIKFNNYDLGQAYIPQDSSEQSFEDDDQSQQVDQVNQLPANDDLSPSINRSPAIRRANSLQPSSSRLS